MLPCVCVADERAYLRPFVRLCVFACVCIYVRACLRACVCHVTMMFRSLTSWCCFRHLPSRKLRQLCPDPRAVGWRPGSHSVRSQERRHQVLVPTEGSSRRVLVEVSRKRSVQHHQSVAALLQDDLHTALTTTCSSGRPDVNCCNKHIYVDIYHICCLSSISTTT